MNQPYVHINVTGALKARWVKASRDRGMKLGDYLLELIERAEAMNTYPIPESLSGQYHGAGWALAAITERAMHAPGQHGGQRSRGTSVLPS